jgi:DNA-binding transcriptional LysR family regulator
MDWNQLRSFLATAEGGSLSAAARKLGLSQPTLSRQVAALERALGVTLFERVGRSVQLTDAGIALVEHARAMRAAADDLALAASGQAQGVEGPVSISASDAVAAWLLPPILARLREQAPGIVVEVISSNSLADLRRREADIAVRHVRPDHPDLIGRLVREGIASHYASRGYVARHGHPRRADDIEGHRFIGTDRSGRYLEHLRAYGLPVRAAQFAAVSENVVVSWRLVEEGVGICALMDEIAARMTGLVRVLDEMPPIRFPFWLVTHRELRTSRRMRVVFEALAQGLAAGPEQAEGSVIPALRPHVSAQPRGTVPPAVGRSDL